MENYKIITKNEFIVIKKANKGGAVAGLNETHY